MRPSFFIHDLVVLYTAMYVMFGSKSQGLVTAIAFPVQQVTAPTPTSIFYKTKKTV
jgi:hypothetical protein